MSILTCQHTRAWCPLKNDVNFCLGRQYKRRLYYILSLPLNSYPSLMKIWLVSQNFLSSWLLVCIRSLLPIALWLFVGKRRGMADSRVYSVLQFPFACLASCYSFVLDLFLHFKYMVTDYVFALWHISPWVLFICVCVCVCVLFLGGFFVLTS